MVLSASFVGIVALTGCAQRDEPAVQVQPPPVVVAVAPVLNLSNSADWDPLKVTDILASELGTFAGVVVVPVNRSLAALSEGGRSGVRTPREALELARALGADGTVVAAVTEYSPYDPPIIGLTVQWYARDAARPAAAGFDPVSASRQATEVAPAEYADAADLAPVLQVQRVYNAAENAVRKSIREYAGQRRGYESPYGWRLHTASQELFVRYACWASLKSMLLARESQSDGPATDETQEWKQDGDA